MRSKRCSFCFGTLFLGVLVLTAGSAWAVPVTIQNPSFEAVVLANGAFTPSIPSWSFSGGDTGTFNPTVAAYPAEAPDGQNVAYVSQGSAPGDIVTQQILSELLTAGTTYTLEVQVGQRADGLTFGSFDLQLVAGGVVLASNNTASPAAGTFQNVMVVHTPSAGDPQLGQALEIRLVASVAGGQQINLDDVRLDAAPQVPTVPGVGLVILAVALAALGAVFAARRRQITSY